MPVVSLGEMVAEQVKKTPDVISVIYHEDKESCCVKITYTEMWQRAHKICAELKKHGSHNEVIAVCTEPGINVPSVLLGIIHAFSAYFPFGQDGTGFVLQTFQQLGIKHILLDTSVLENLRSMLLELQATIVPSEELQNLGLLLMQVPLVGSSEKASCNVNNLAYCITTSGTTGTPKIVRVPHCCVVPNIVDFGKEFQLSAGDIIFLSAPLTFDPSVIDIFMTLTTGATLLLVGSAIKLSPNSLLALLSNMYRVSVLQITPSLFRRFNPDAVKRSLLGVDSSLRVLAFGGEPFPQQEVMNGYLHPENSTIIYNLYGITEVSCWATWHCARIPRGIIQYPVPIGKTLTGTKVKLVNEAGNELRTGRGHILIGGSERTCLVNEEDEQILINGAIWRRTGDMGRIDSQGNIFCLGRDDKQIKRNGKRMNLDTLDKVCRDVDKVLDCQSVYSESRLHLFVKMKEQREEEVDKMHNCVKFHLLRTLPSQYQPDFITLLPEFPVNLHGKVDIAALLKLSGSYRKLKHKQVLSVESWSGKLWQDLTNHEDRLPSTADQFLSCGGDSLRAVHFADEIEQHLGKQIPDLLDTILTKTWGNLLSLLIQYAGKNDTAVKSLITVKKEIQLTDHEESEILFKTIKKSKAAQLTSPDKNESSGNWKKLLGPQQLHSQNKLAALNAQAKKRKRSNKMFGCEDHGVLHSIVKGRKCSTYQSSAKDLETDLNKEQISGVSSCEQRNLCQKGILSPDVLVKFPSDLKLTKPQIPSCAYKFLTAAATFSAKQHEKQTVLAQNDTKFETTQIRVGIPRENMAISKDDSFIRSVTRGNCFMLTTAIKPNMNYPVSHKDLRCTSEIEEESCLDSKHSEKERVRLDLQWTVNTGKCVDASPLVASSRCERAVVFIGSHSHQFMAIDLKCGTVIWTTELGDRVESSACLSPCGQRVAVGCYDHNIYILNADTGQIAWQVKTGDVVKCSPKADLASGLVFCGSHDGYLYSFHCGEQNVVWKSHLGGGGIFASPVVSSDGRIVYAGSLGGQIAALSVMTGSLIWRISLGKPIFSSPAVHAGFLYVGCVDNSLNCLLEATGEQLWVYKTEAPVFSSPVVSTTSGTKLHHILFGCHDNHIYCLSSSGQLVWQNTTNSAVYATTFVFNIGTAADSSQTEKSCGLSVLARESKPGEGQGRHLICQSDGQWAAESPQNILTQNKDSWESDEELPVSCSKIKQASTQANRKCLDNPDPVTHTATKTRNTRDSTWENNARMSKVFVACVATTGELNILCSTTGAQLGGTHLPGSVFSSPVIVDNHLVVGCRDDRVYCYKLFLN